MPLDLLTIGFLTVLKFFLGFFSVIVGGTGLILIPTMIGLGVPAVESVAVARVSNTGSAASSLWVFNKAGELDRRLGIKLALVSLVSSLSASLFVLSLNEALLTQLIGVIILVLLGIILVGQKIGLEQGKTSLAKQTLGYIMVFVAVFIATITGASGILMSYVLILFFGQTFLKSSGTRKIVNVASVFLATIVFAFAGVVIWELALPLLLAGAVGGWLGARYALKKGNVWYKRVFVVIVAILAIRMLVVG